MITLRSALRKATERLLAAGVENAEREVLWMTAHLLGCGAGALWTQMNRILLPDEVTQLEGVIGRRVDREPLQYILGSEEFMGFSFKVTPAVLIPRPDTEALVRAAAERLPAAVRIADIGTGSGIIAISLARLLPRATVVAVDMSPEALAVARENAVAHQVAERIDFRMGDCLAPLVGERFGAILSNPPYIAEVELPTLMPEVRDWEPRLALTPGPDGLAFFRLLAASAPDLLLPGGLLGVEVGAGQAPAVAAMFWESGLSVTVYHDGGGIERAVIGSLFG